MKRLSKDGGPMQIKERKIKKKGRIEAQEKRPRGGGPGSQSLPTTC